MARHSFHTNLSTRVVKSPKLYFYDTRLAAGSADITVEKLKEGRYLVGGDQIQHRTTTTVLPWNKTYELFDVKK